MQRDVWFKGGIDNIVEENSVLSSPNLNAGSNKILQFITGDAG